MDSMEPSSPPVWRHALSLTFLLTFVLTACSGGSRPQKPSVSAAPSVEPTGPVTPTGTYTDLHWPAGEYSAFEWTLRVERDPSPAGYFWAHQFHFAGGDGGYLGLQTLGGDPAKAPGKVAIFSIWNALGAEGPGYSGPFGGEGTGYTARIYYPWIEGRDYRLRIEQAEPAAAEGAWAAWVKDEVTGREEFVGRIRVPGRWGPLSATSVMWTERYAGEASSCDDLGHSIVSFTSPTADGGRVAPAGTTNHLAEPPGSCRNSDITNVAGEMRHQMGITRPGHSQ